VSRAVSRLPEASVAVIGGGIIGLSIAWQLAREGWRVAVLEKNLAGGEASWAGAGMLSPGGEVEGHSALADLAMESRELYGRFIRELEAASGFAIDYQECGAVDLAYGAEEMQHLEERGACQASLGIVSKPVLADQIAAFWPRLRTKGLKGGRFYPEDAIVNPREVVLATAAACRKQDVQILQNCEVTRIEIGERAARVQACGMNAAYQAAVIAAGAWSNEIAVEGVAPIPVAEPVKGHLIGYQQPAQTCNTIVRHGHSYFLQRANGLLIAGTSVERVGFDREVRREIVAGLQSQTEFIFPHLCETKPSEAWMGFRPASDAVHIEAWHSERLYLAYGHYRNGILLAPVTAQKIVKQLNANLRTR
jgi:glycine oxidase